MRRAPRAPAVTLDVSTIAVYTPAPPTPVAFPQPGLATATLIFLPTPGFRAGLAILKAVCEPPVSARDLGYFIGGTARGAIQVIRLSLSSDCTFYNYYSIPFVPPVEGSGWVKAGTSPSWKPYATTTFLLWGCKASTDKNRMRKPSLVTLPRPHHEN